MVHEQCNISIYWNIAFPKYIFPLLYNIALTTVCGGALDGLARLDLGVEVVLGGANDRTFSSSIHCEPMAWFWAGYWLCWPCPCPCLYSSYVLPAVLADWKGKNNVHIYEYTLLIFLSGQFYVMLCLPYILPDCCTMQCCCCKRQCGCWEVGYKGQCQCSYLALRCNPQGRCGCLEVDPGCKHLGCW